MQSSQLEICDWPESHIYKSWANLSAKMKLWNIKIDPALTVRKPYCEVTWNVPQVNKKSFTAEPETFLNEKTHEMKISTFRNLIY